MLVCYACGALLVLPTCACVLCVCAVLVRCACVLCLFAVLVLIACTSVQRRSEHHPPGAERVGGSQRSAACVVGYWDCFCCRGGRGGHQHQPPRDTAAAVDEMQVFLCAFTVYMLLLILSYIYATGARR